MVTGIRRAARGGHPKLGATLLIELPESTATALRSHFSRPACTQGVTGQWAAGDLGPCKLDAQSMLCGCVCACTCEHACGCISLGTRLMAFIRFSKTSRTTKRLIIAVLLRNVENRSIPCAQEEKKQFKNGINIPKKGKETEVAQLCPTLWDPVDCSPPGSSVRGILQARILEWGAISFSRGSS